LKIHDGDADELENQAGGGEFRLETVPKDFSEAPLVVVKQLLSLVVDGANINNDVAGFENRWVSSAFHLCNVVDQITERVT
jgi:hypothetical protein